MESFSAPTIAKFLNCFRDFNNNRARSARGKFMRGHRKNISGDANMRVTNKISAHVFNTFSNYLPADHLMRAPIFHLANLTTVRGFFTPATTQFRGAFTTNAFLNFHL
jgi:hypothetical protein